LDDEQYDQITVSQMLTHTSGMPDTDEYYWDRPEYDDGAVERYVRSLSSAKLESAPGENFAYSNIAYEVLGDLISKVSGQPFEEYIADHILKPLGMATSTFFKQKVPPSLGATPHVTILSTEVSPIYPYNRRHAASSTLHSSALELCRWASAGLNYGLLDGVRILDAQVWEQMWQPRRETGNGNAIALGWFVGEYRGRRVVGHDGGDVGFTSNLALLPDDQIGVAVMCNTAPAYLEAVTHMILDLILGIEPEPPKPHVLVALGRTIQAQGVETAATHYQKLVDEQADDFDFALSGFANRAWDMVDLRHPLIAIQILQLALVANPAIAETPESYDLYAVLGKAYAKTGDYEQAQAHWQKSLALNPQQPWVQKGLEQLSETRQS
jgi:CubicO group peptidase (beta-lactamase class C family)